MKSAEPEPSSHSVQLTIGFMKEINQNSTSPGVPQPGLSKHGQREERWVLFMQLGGHQLFQMQSGALSTLGKSFTTYQCHFPNPLNYILIITNMNSVHIKLIYNIDGMDCVTFFSLISRPFHLTH